MRNQNLQQTLLVFILIITSMTLSGTVIRRERNVMLDTVHCLMTDDERAVNLYSDAL